MTRAARRADVTVPRRIAVACSGGRDSTALLHATLRAAAPLGLEVVALHVHHGLMPSADAWQRQLEAQCTRWARAGWPLHLVCTRLGSRPAAGDSLEAWAREQRYRALSEMAQAAGCGAVLLAHHQRDQAETFLLQALRGAGVAGLAAMPKAAQRDGIAWLRPWLGQPHRAIGAYVHRHRLRHVEDDSNTDTRLARNRLRLEVWPALVEAFPQAEAVLADAAARSAEAMQALEELATIDLAATTVAAPGAELRLELTAWWGLSPARRGNALRAWLKQAAGRTAPASLVQRLMSDLDGRPSPGRGGRQWPFDDLWVRERAGMLLLARSAEAGPVGPPAAPATQPLCLRRAGRHAVPAWGGVLVVRRVSENGVPMAWLARAELRARQGGEQFQLGPGRPPRSLKKQFQGADVPAWQRHGPLLYSGGLLVFVPGLGIDARVIGLPGQPLVSLEWEAATPQA